MGSNFSTPKLAVALGAVIVANANNGSGSIHCCDFTENGWLFAGISDNVCADNTSDEIGDVNADDVVVSGIRMVVISVFDVISTFCKARCDFSETGAFEISPDSSLMTCETDIGL